MDIVHDGDLGTKLEEQKACFPSVYRAVLLMSAWRSDYASVDFTDPQKAPHKTGAFEKLILSREFLLSFSFPRVNWGYISELRRKE